MNFEYECIAMPATFANPERRYIWTATMRFGYTEPPRSDALWQTIGQEFCDCLEYVLTIGRLTVLDIEVTEDDDGEGLYIQATAILGNERAESVDR